MITPYPPVPDGDCYTRDYSADTKVFQSQYETVTALSIMVHGLHACPSWLI